MCPGTSTPVAAGVPTTRGTDMTIDTATPNTNAAAVARFVTAVDAGELAAKNAAEGERKEHNVKEHGLSIYALAIHDVLTHGLVKGRGRGKAVRQRKLAKPIFDAYTAAGLSANVLKNIREPAFAMVEGKLATSDAFLDTLGDDTSFWTVERIDSALRLTQVSYLDGASTRCIDSRNSLLVAAKAPEDPKAMLLRVAQAAAEKALRATRKAVAPAAVAGILAKAGENAVKADTKRRQKAQAKAA